MTDQYSDIQQILQGVPYRYPFLFLDRVLDMDIERGSGKGIKNVTINEHFFVGHFKDRPVLPGVIALESIAQLSVYVGLKYLVNKKIISNIKDAVFVFTGVRNARFKKQIVPGDQMIIQAFLSRQKGRYFIFDGMIQVDDNIAVKAEFSAMYID